MKTAAVFLSVALFAAVSFTAGIYLGQGALKHRGIFLSDSSPARGEVCSALAEHVFAVADRVSAARAAGRTAEELNRSMSGKNWSYEPADGGFVIYWKLSYDDTFIYDSDSDSVRGTNDFESTTKRRRPDKI